MKLNKALAKCQGEFPPIRFDAENSHFGSRYATLHALLSAVVPVLSRNGIALMQHPTTEGNRLTIVTELLFEDEVRSSSCGWDLPADTTPQKLGAAVTYLKRIALQGVLSVAGEDDDDGNSISTPRGTVPRKTAQRQGTASGGAQRQGTASGGRAAAPAETPAGELTTEGRVTEHKFGTTKAGREWLIATVVDLSSGEAVKVGTFSRTYIDALRKSSGTDQVWRVTHAPGKKDDTRDIVKVLPVNEAGEALLEGIPF